MRSVLRLLLALLFLCLTAGFYMLFTGGQLPRWKQHHPRAAPPVAPGQLAPSGGQYFFKKKLIPVEIVRQAAKAWAKEPLAWGQNNETIGSHGCAVACVAMVFKSYGIATTPKELNATLKSNKGYTAEGWLMWEKAVELAPGKTRFLYEGPATYPLIDTHLSQGNPVIVRLRRPPEDPAEGDGSAHFVVICGKEGLDYLIADPGEGSSRGIYPLKDYGSNIEALRCYEPIIPPRAIPVVRKALPR